MSSRHRDTLTGYGFISPVLVGMLLWTLIPMGASLYYSFTRYDLPQSPKFIGADNYTALFHDSTFYNSLKVTVIFAAVSVPLGLFVGLMIAVMLNQRVAGMRVFRTLIYLPAVIPVVASTIVFKDMLSSSNLGLINYVLMKLHLIGKPIPFFTSPSTALWSVIFMGMWGAGGSMLVWLAGLQSVPEDLYDACRVDGAGAFRRFFSSDICALSNATYQLIQVLPIPAGRVAQARNDLMAARRLSVSRASARSRHSATIHGEPARVRSAVDLCMAASCLPTWMA